MSDAAIIRSLIRQGCRDFWRQEREWKRLEAMAERDQWGRSRESERGTAERTERKP